MVVSFTYPFLRIKFAIGTFEKEVLAYIDTGFDGYIVIPERFTQELGEPDYMSEWELPGDYLVEAWDYLGILEILGLGETLEVRVTTLGEEFIIGRAVIDRYRITFDRGEKVIVER